MQRRKFITLLGGTAASPWTWSLAAFGQASDKSPRRIGYIGASSPSAVARNLGAFLDGMRAHGYVEGPDIEIDYRWAEGHIERLPTLAQELVRSKIDVILASTVASAVAAKDATKTIPIVSPLLGDPVRFGLIQSEARPGGNVTGRLAAAQPLASEVCGSGGDRSSSPSRSRLPCAWFAAGKAFGRSRARSTWATRRSHGCSSGRLHNSAR
jgi:putative tryptophan/tyrosine transport system substrate-binding protein